MRRALVKSWPALSYHFGLHPWDLERLTPAELRAYLDDLDAMNRAAKKKR